MQIIDSPIPLKKLHEMAKRRFGNLVKAVVDVEKKHMAVDAELHADEEAALLARGGQRKDIWGIKLHPDLYGSENFIEFDAMINVRPELKNMSRGVDNPDMKNKIVSVVTTLIT